MTFRARQLSRLETVAEHLKRRGHISEGSALLEYGRFRLADVIHRLRRERQDLVPDGFVIVTIHKKDTQGNGYGEYHLVKTAATAERERLERGREMAARVRAKLNSPENYHAHRDELSLTEGVLSGQY